jgi:SAM-dependent methyltransferase
MTVTGTPDLEAIKQVQQQTWATGDYSMVAARIQFVAEQLAESAELRAGWNVLDVATGSGNAAIAAARSGTSGTGVDYTPSLLEDARARAAAEGLDVEFVEGDAEHLPVDTGHFDAVLSVYGCMFAPDHVRTAQEIARACRPGGTIALASWTADSFVGDMFRAMSKYAPPPAGVASPMLWGDEAHLHEIFGDTIGELTSTRRVCTFRYESAEDFASFFRRYYGPTNRAFGRLDDANQRSLFADLVTIADAADTFRDGGSVSIPAGYLETIIRRA